MTTFRNLLRDEGGATAIEYGLICALIGAVIISAVAAVGTNLTAMFTTVGSQV
jgi:pilus assembly protein Flp/PilA